MLYAALCADERMLVFTERRAPPERIATHLPYTVRDLILKRRDYFETTRQLNWTISALQSSGHYTMLAIDFVAVLNRKEKIRGIGAKLLRQLHKVFYTKFPYRPTTED